MVHLNFLSVIRKVSYNSLRPVRTIINRTVSTWLILGDAVFQRFHINLVGWIEEERYAESVLAFVRQDLMDGSFVQFIGPNLCHVSNVDNIRT